MLKFEMDHHFESESLKPDILIVGAGIAGCSLAVRLHEQGHKVVLVERTNEPQKLFKGEYIQPGAAAKLIEIGFGDIFDTPTSSKIAALNFRELDTKYNSQSGPDLSMVYPKATPALAIEHIDLISTIQSKTAQVLGSNFIRGVELKPENSSSPEFLNNPRFRLLKSKATQKDIFIQPKWVIGCDGKFSQVRKWMGGEAAAPKGQVVMGAGPELILGAHVPFQFKSKNQYEVYRLPSGLGTLSIFPLGKAGSRLYLSSPFNKAGEALDIRQKFKDCLQSHEILRQFPIWSDSATVAACPAHTQWFGFPKNSGKFLLAGDSLGVSTPFGGQGITLVMSQVTFLTQQFKWKCNSISDVENEKEKFYLHSASAFERVGFLNFGLYYTFFARHSIFISTSKFTIAAWNKNPELKDRVVRLFGAIDEDTPRLLEILDLESKGFLRIPATYLPKIVKVKWA